MAPVAALRNPEDHFADLPDNPFGLHLLDDTDGLRMLNIHTGDADGPGFLCLHDQPSWSYLYRKMMPVFARAGRVIAPGLLGFGWSDKPADQSTHRFSYYCDSLLHYLRRAESKALPARSDRTHMATLLYSTAIIFERDRTNHTSRAKIS
jgi:haloalkane dehalogenase